MAFREYVISTGRLILGGKSSKNNEELIAQVDSKEYVLHTSLPGSPFVNLKDNGKKISNKEILEAAVFCARHSQAWRDTKSNVKVDVFLGKDIHKDNKMKEGTFGVKKKKTIEVKKGDILNFGK